MRDDVVGDGTQVLFDRGVLGVVVVALAFVAWWLVRREVARAEAAQAQVDALNARIRDEILPAVLNAATQHAAVTALLTKIGDLLPDVAAALRDYDRGRR